MILMRSDHSRRFIGRLDPGTALLPALRDLCIEKQIRCAEIRATGFLKNVVLEVFHHEKGKYRPTVLGPHTYQLTSFLGNVSMLHTEELVVHIHATLRPDLATGDTHLAGGRIKEAEVVALEMTLDTFDDFTLVRRPDPETGLEQWVELNLEGQGHRPVATPSPSDAAREPDEPEEPEDLEAGDILDHPRLGCCTVVSSDGERAVIRLESGRTVELHLGVAKLTLKEGTKRGERTFDVTIRPRR